MDATLGKIISMLLFFFGALLSTLLPVILSRKQTSVKSSRGPTVCQRLIDFCNCIGGGVLLATCFISLVPLVERSYNKAIALRDSLEADRPYAEITILMGFFLVIFLEQGILLFQHKQTGHSHHESPEEELLFESSEENHGHSNNSYSGSGHTHDGGGHCHSGGGHTHDGGGHSHSGAAHSHGGLMMETKSLLHSIILVITLGLHTLFEGMAIGLVSNVDLLATLVIAVMVHEICCAVALGVNLGQQEIKMAAAVSVCIVFSLMMPFGIGLGLALGQIQGFTGLLLTAILQGIATGTFIYVLFMEIIPSTICHGNAFIHMLMMLVGCVLMTVVIIFTHSHHGHSPTPLSSTEAIFNSFNCSSNSSLLP